MLDTLWDKKIGVLAGGASNEREISLKSGNAVLSALKKKGLNVHLIDVDPSSFHLDVEVSRIDVAFIALHGEFGEDGTVQNMLDEKGVAYTGSGPGSSRSALDKIASKKVFIEAGLLVPGYDVVDKNDDIDYTGIGLPCVIKPQYEGSSIGLTVVNDPEEIPAAIERAFRCGERIMIEDFIPGREITVGILGDMPLEVIEIKPDGGVYDFKAKYQSSITEYIVPAELEENVAVKAKEAALKAHQALGCKGLSRADFRLGSNGDIFILEVNTIPGMTEKSLLPMAAKACGIEFGDLCVKILENAIEA